MIIYLDFGKWIYGLENTDYDSDYDYILLIK